MRWRDHAAVLVGALIVSSCGSSSPATPSPSPTAHYQLSGTVRTTTQGVLVGASVLVVDGADSGRTTTADASGHYQISGLQGGGFTVRASRDGYQSDARGVTLNADTVLDFALTRVPRALLAAEGPVTYSAVPPAYVAYNFKGMARNVGDGCASTIAGNMSVVDSTLATIATRAFSLPVSVIVRPNEAFPYDGCCFSTAELTLGSTYHTAFTFETVACP